MRRSYKPRQVIQFGLFLAVISFLTFLVLSKPDYAALTYPPIPKDEYPYIQEAIKHCKFGPEVAEQMESVVAAVAYVESRFSQRANIVSSAGAVGRMQLLRPTLSGVGVKYQIPGINAESANDPRISYLGGTCYLHYMMETMTGDGGSAVSWANERNREAVFIGYNAGPARGKSYLAGNYNGPLSSIGYAKKVEQASKIYRLDVAKLRQQQDISVADSLSYQLRNLIWGFLLPTEEPDDPANQ